MNSIILEPPSSQCDVKDEEFAPNSRFTAGP